MITIIDYAVPSPKQFQLSIRGLRFSWGSNDKSDSCYVSDVDIEKCLDVEVFQMGDNDRALLLKLIKAGTDHSKFMRQLPITIDFIAPEYFLKEFDTYKISTVSNRSSMMHTLGKEKFTEDMFSWEDTDITVRTAMLHNLNYHRDRWLDEGGKRKGPDAYAWRAMLQVIPQSWNYRTLWAGNYQTLRSMYFARRNHRLSEWREFCRFITTLPYSELITVE